MDALTHLLLEARDGDRDAFAGAIRAAERPVRRFVSTLVDPEEVEDTVQDVFFRAWRSLPRYRVEAAGQTWLLAIARRACADVVQRRIRRRDVQSRYAAVPPIDVAPDPASAHALSDLVRLLTPDRKEAFVLTQLIGLSYAEAALVCGVPVGTIRSRVARARSDLIVSIHSEAEAG